jgi:hypothetical protein
MRKEFFIKNYHTHQMIHGTHDEGSHAMLRVVYGAVGLWFLAACIGGLRGIFIQPGVPSVTVGLFLLVPIAGFTLAYVAIPRLRDAVDGIPLWSITIAHAWRFVGLGFVLGAMANILPPSSAILRDSGTS